MRRNPRFWTLAAVSIGSLALMAPKFRDFPRHPSFRVEIEGVSVGSFHSIDGPGLTVEVIEFREGNDPLTHKIPRRTTWSNLTLKRGRVENSFFESWIHETRQQAPGFRKNIAVVLLDHQGTETARYNFFNCWPTSWKLSNLEEPRSGQLTEEVVIAIEYFERP